MICLRCGHCCHNMSPFVDEPDEGIVGKGEPCRYLSMSGTVANCDIYESRPDVCASHRFPERVCPIGMDVLGIDDPAVRIAEMRATRTPLFPLLGNNAERSPWEERISKNNKTDGHISPASPSCGWCE